MIPIAIMYLLGAAIIFLLVFVVGVFFVIHKQSKKFYPDEWLNYYYEGDEE